MLFDSKLIAGVAGGAMVVLGVGGYDVRAGLIAAGALVLLDILTWSDKVPHDPG